MNFFPCAAAATAAGVVAMFLGAVMMHDMAAAPYVNWLLPLCLFLGLAVIAAVVGEVLKLKVCAGSQCTAFTAE
jgi:H+/Cl- antiporter ClcA